MIVILTQDLMMSSSAGAAARADGLTLKTVPSVAKALEVCVGQNAQLLLIDLQFPSLNLTELAEGLAGIADECRPHTVAYAQHVNVDLLRAAQAVNFDEVLTRGQMNAGLSQVFAKYVGADEEK